MNDLQVAAPRTIALFPGAFRPPHANHYEVVRDLRDRLDIDEIVVIIANRNRKIPNTTKALDNEVAREVWSIYLAGDQKVRVESAPASGVAHSLGYLESAKPGDRLLFVVGSKDHATLTRFSKLRTYDLAGKGIAVEVVGGAPNVIDARATDLRAMLGEGANGRKAFIAALPGHLTGDQRAAVWTICTNSMTEQRELDLRNIVRVLANNDMQLSESHRYVQADEPKSTYRAVRGDGTPALIKCALDAKSANATSRTTPDKDRRQTLKTERQALKWLHGVLADPIVLPEVMFHDKQTRTLAVTSVLEDGHWLAKDLADGFFDASVAGSLGRFLAQAHNSGSPEQFWDGAHGDSDHWRAVLARRTRPGLVSDLRSTARLALDQLRLASDQAATYGFRHLDFGAHVCRVEGRRVAVVNFERCANVGDPAIDVGSLLGNYIYEGLRQNAQKSAALMVTSVARSYSDAHPERWAEIATRSAAFAGIKVLESLDQVSGAPSTHKREFLPAVERLLTIDLNAGPAQARSALLSSLTVSGSLSSTTRSPLLAAHRRFLRRSDPSTYWEGHVRREREHEVITVEVFGGVPRTMVDLMVDDSWRSSAELDSIGSATLTIEAERSASSVLVLSDQRPVLEGTIPT